MRGDPVIWVYCDTEGCEWEEDNVPITATARGYDERNVDQWLSSNGWSCLDGADYCPDCTIRRTEEARHARRAELERELAELTEVET